MVGRIRGDPAGSGLSPHHRAALHYTDVFLSDPREMSDALRREMLRELSAEEIVELTAGIALFLGFSKIAIALGGVPDSLPVMELPTPDWPG